MIMEDRNESAILRKIDLGEAYRKIMRNKKLFSITLVSTLLLSSIIIFSVPRYYICMVKLAPETANSNLGNLSSLASSFGLNMPSITQQDIMESVDFQAEMFPVIVTSKDGKLKTSYYDYLHNYQKRAWWVKIVTWLVGKFRKEKNKMGYKGETKVNPFKLTEVQYDIADMVNDNVNCNVDKKTDVITITIKDQDPLICATIADSAKSKLQQFITRYRTDKARNDLAHAQKLCIQAKTRYIKAQQVYAAYMDANEDVVLQSFKSKQEEMENEMQLRYDNYQMTTRQVQLAQAKLQERTPVFTTLQSATVPIKPAGPKRMLFVLVVVLCTFIVTSLYSFVRK